jgi:hypothetical protein
MLQDMSTTCLLGHETESNKNGQGTCRTVQSAAMITMKVLNPAMYRSRTVLSATPCSALGSKFMNEPSFKEFQFDHNICINHETCISATNYRPTIYKQSITSCVRFATTHMTWRSASPSLSPRWESRISPGFLPMYVRVRSTILRTMSYVMLCDIVYVQCRMRYPTCPHEQYHTPWTYKIVGCNIVRQDVWYSMFHRCRMCMDSAVYADVSSKIAFDESLPVFIQQSDTIASQPCLQPQPPPGPLSPLLAYF